jgi:hypothetical protein
MIGKPAASADVHPSGRNEFRLRSQTLIWCASHCPEADSDGRRARNVSYRTLADRSYTRRCESPRSPGGAGPVGVSPSITAFAGIGMPTRSLSSA